MTPVFSYLAGRAGYRIAEFFRRWYVKSAKTYLNFTLDRFARLDRFFAWKITAWHLFEPLYRDYSLVGYVLGFFFRSIRLLAGSAVYSVFFALALTAYLAWLSIPPLLLLLGVASFVIA